MRGELSAASGLDQHTIGIEIPNDHFMLRRPSKVSAAAKVVKEFFTSIPGLGGAYRGSLARCSH
jgi:hypothetical protein